MFAKLMRCVCYLLLMTAICTTPALAQKKPPAEEGPKEAWVISYAIILLCVGGSLFGVLRPGRRDPRK